MPVPGDNLGKPPAPSLYSSKIKESNVLEDFGNCVGINGRIVPAVNIQVENVPGFLEHNDGTAAWYGVYFEILFEQGYLWVVEQGAEELEPTSKITIDVYGDYTHRDRYKDFPAEPDVRIPVAHWDEFLEVYDARDEYWGAVALPCYADFILGKM